jgi:hypothetical protein
MLQKANRRAAAEKTVRKIEAGAIAFVTAQTISLSTGRAGQASLVWVVRYALNKFSLGTAMLGCRQLVPVVSRWTQNTRFIMQQRRVEKIKNGLIQTV